jgi:hypothetical protein
VAFGHGHPLVLLKKTLLLARLERQKRKEKRLLPITAGCVKEVKLGAQGRQLKLRAMEKDGINIDISKREDIASVVLPTMTAGRPIKTHTEEEQPSVLPVIIVHRWSSGTKKMHPRSYHLNV